MIRKLTENEKRGFDFFRTGQLIRYCRRETNLRSSELAEMLHISRQALHKIEEKGSVPRTERLIQLSVIFGVSIQDLLPGFNENESCPKVVGRSFTVDIMIDPKAAGKNLKEMRLQNGMSLERLSFEYSLSAYDTWSINNIRSCEQGKTLPSAEHLFILARMYGVTVDALLDGAVRIADPEICESEEMDEAPRRDAA